VWNETGQLVFSSDQRDRLGQDAGFAEVLGRVLDGSTVSEVTGQRVPQEPGLAGSNEKLLRTYVPMRLGDQTSASAVAQIDQRYSAIQASAQKVWRPAQIGIGAALALTIVLFVLSLRSGTGSASGIAADPRAAERARSLERRTKDLENRLKHAEELAREASERFDETSKAKVALERQLAASEQNLRDTLTVRNANEQDAAALSARVPELERELAELRARAAEPASGASPEELAEAQARAAAAEQRLAGIEARSASSVEQAQADIDRISIRLSETQAALAEATDERTRMQADLERVQQERAEALAGLERAGVVTGERDQEDEGLRGTIAERDRELEGLREAAAQVETLRGDVVAKSGELDALRLQGTALATELETLRGEAVARTAELERVHDELQRATADAQVAAPQDDDQLDELRRRVAELEELRGADAEEVRQAHEQLANAHLELEQTRASIEQLLGVSVTSAPADASRLAQESAAAEPHAESGPSEGLSLSERLTRAAAARQRVSTPPDRDRR
jgi:chromosome segregation ATPase